MRVSTARNMRHRRSVLRFFLLVLLPMVGLSHLYFIRRLVLDPGFAPLLAWGIALGGVTILAAPFARARLRPRLARLVLVPASTWLGFAFLLLVSVSASDLLTALLGLLVPSAEAGSRMALVDSRLQAFGVVALTSLAGAAGLVSALAPPKARRHEVFVTRWPQALDGFRIVQLSDLHVGPMRGRRFVEAVVSRTNALDPDLVAVTGDIVDGDVESLAAELAPFSALRSRHGAFFVTGNHEYFSRADPWIGCLRELGLRPLRNERVAVGDDGASFDLAGVDDHYARHFGGDHGEDLERALEGRDASRAVVLLAHNPSIFDRAAELGVDLQISGHTHGGQIWPFHYLVRLVVPYVAGAYHRHRSQLYVSRGTGFWGPPLRLFAPAEITEIVIRRAATES
ncbi:MAG: metallophosphoesterase [Candidatus Binatia bacterium]